MISTNRSTLHFITAEQEIYYIHISHIGSCFVDCLHRKWQGAAVKYRLPEWVFCGDKNQTRRQSRGVTWPGRCSCLTVLPSVVYHPDCVPNHFTPEAALFTVNKKNNNKNKYRHVQSDQRVRLNPANDRLTLVCGGFLSLPHLLLHHDAVEQWVGVPASHPHRNVPCHLSEPESSGGLQHVSPNLRSQTCVVFFFPSETLLWTNLHP